MWLLRLWWLIPLLLLEARAWWPLLRWLVPLLLLRPLGLGSLGSLGCRGVVGWEARNNLCCWDVHRLLGRLGLGAPAR